ncbi:MAG: ABC transporter ATP-binding protein [Candidatus Omnitrophica bacterium]|nr:ABC transporter ATP-binding protein [Candidatus Omnitrophota bacterium]
MTVILEAVHVSKSFPRRGGVLRRQLGAVQAVERVSLALGTGESLGLVGESGSGKTTLAKLFIGLLRPTEGEVLVRGASWFRLRGGERLAARRTVQFVFQDPMNSLNPRMTVEEALSEPLSIHRLAAGASRRARVDALLELVRLSTSYRRRLPRELSGGERQRVGIARALAVEPAALICDEPIASLDVSVGAQILELLRALCRERRLALLFISHDLRAVASLCRRIAVMREGKLLELAPTEQIVNRPGHPYTTLLLRSAELDLDQA